MGLEQPGRKSSGQRDDLGGRVAVSGCCSFQKGVFFLAVPELST
jgi:hypothetical protein